MRNKCVFTEDRNMDLIRAYRLVLTNENVSTRMQAISMAIKYPSKRFWVTPECATKAINRMRRGDMLNEMKNHRRKMFFELFRRYTDARKQKEFKNKSVSYIASVIVYQEAPEFYITVETAMKLYKKQMRCLKR